VLKDHQDAFRHEIYDYYKGTGWRIEAILESGYSPYIAVLEKAR